MWLEFCRWQELGPGSGHVGESEGGREGRLVEASTPHSRPLTPFPHPQVPLKGATAPGSSGMRGKRLGKN